MTIGEGRLPLILGDQDLREHALLPLASTNPVNHLVLVLLLPLALWSDAQLVQCLDVQLALLEPESVESRRVEYARCQARAGLPFDQIREVRVLLGRESAC